MIEKYKNNLIQFIQSCGDDPSREGLQDTPERHIKAMQTLTMGYHQTLDDVVNNALFTTDSNEMVVVENIELYSLCEHHLLPFYGRCHVSYLPNKTVLGLSKVARIVDMFCRRFQIQENLTHQIAEAIQEVTHAHGVGVIIEAKHFCMMMRGIEKQNSTMMTSAMLGAYKENTLTRNEFLQLALHNNTVFS